MIKMFGNLETRPLTHSLSSLPIPGRSQKLDWEKKKNMTHNALGQLSLCTGQVLTAVAVSLADMCLI